MELLSNHSAFQTANTWCIPKLSNKFCSSCGHDWFLLQGTCGFLPELPCCQYLTQAEEGLKKAWRARRITFQTTKVTPVLFFFIFGCCRCLQNLDACGYKKVTVYSLCLPVEVDHQWKRKMDRQADSWRRCTWRPSSYEEKYLKTDVTGVTLIFGLYYCTYVYIYIELYRCYILYTYSNYTNYAHPIFGDAMSCLISVTWQILQWPHNADNLNLVVRHPFRESRILAPKSEWGWVIT